MFLLCQFSPYMFWNKLNILSEKRLIFIYKYVWNFEAIIDASKRPFDNMTIFFLH